MSLEPQDAELEVNSVLASGGMVVGMVTGAAIGVGVAGPVWVVVGAALGAVAGVLGGAAAGATANPDDSSHTETPKQRLRTKCACTSKTAVAAAGRWC